VLAHRGFAVDAPENTLLAFLHAISIGVTHLETDVHGSSDGVAMISHDPDLRRLTGRDIRVGDLTAAELRAIDLGQGQNFCSLADALDAFPDAKFNIDVKDQRAVAGTIEAIAQARATSRVLIGSFGTSRRRATIQGLPGVATSISMVPALFAVVAAKLGLVGLVRWIVRRVDAVQLPARKFGFSITTPRTIRRFQAAGVEVHAWTINDPTQMQSLLDAGIDGLVSDRPDLALELLRPTS
jgi:glycerophosphoryl diester phosphodiesterase